MYRKRKQQKVMAIFLLVTFLQSVILPPMAQALTSGPTAPEATSFEPVDATDMVNLMTGDFTYNVPLLEVPGPEGGYPLALSYHAGIKPLEDASWVGLGWNLSPGAINRLVNGYPDDHKGVERTVIDNWEGGTTKTFSVGVGVGIPQGPSFGLNYSVSNDTYEGRNGDISIDFGMGGAQVSVSNSGIIASRLIGIATKQGINLGIKGSTDFNGNNSLGFNASYKNAISLGANMSSGGIKGSVQAGGAQISTSNNNIGNISTSSRSGGLSINTPPIPTLGNLSFNLSIGSQYTRYWIHERDALRTNGVLNIANDPTGVYGGGPLGDEPREEQFYITNEDVSFDSYRLSDKTLNIAEHDDPTWVEGGSLPAYDAYQVNAQGVSGSIQPYIFNNPYLHGQRIKNRDGSINVEYYRTKDNEGEVNFRFKNDFSNKAKINTGPTINYNSLFTTSGYDAAYGEDGSDGFNANTNHLAGSQHIEKFTNQQIRQGDAAGFIDNSNLTGGEREIFLGEYSLDNQIGGFSITNASGVTYHFGLPVYTYDEVIRTEKEDAQNGDSWNEQQNKVPYAYTWLLTSITGADFVDKNNNGKADGDDWGYWVAFDYGKWTNAYQWRTPAEGFNFDIDNSVKNYSYGKKEIYYLDAIKTRTHTALFIKDIRNDGKGVSSQSTGGFAPKRSQVVCEDEETTTETIFSELPISQMRLDRIMLLKNTEGGLDLESVKSSGTMPGDQVVFHINACSPSTKTVNYHLSNNVLDVSDGFPEDGSLHIIKTVILGNNYYELCPNTNNSYNNTSLYPASVPANHSIVTGEKTGKLTLKSIAYKGLNNISTLPPLNFHYESTTANRNSLNLDYPNTRVTVGGANQDWEGEIVKVIGKDYYLLLKNHVVGATFDYEALGENQPNSSLNNGFTCEITKNPPFEKDKYDFWGFYKADFKGDDKIAPTHVSRTPNRISAKSSDAWCLREIETSLGAKIKIDYESKNYANVVWQKYNRMNINKITTNTNGSLTLEFHEGLDLTTLFSSAPSVPISVPLRTSTSNPSEPEPLYEVQTKTCAIRSVSENQLTVTNLFPSDALFYDAGFVDIMPDIDNVGNGIRVKSVMIDGNNNKRQTNYQYANGTISYIPSSLEYIFNLPNDQGYAYIDQLKEDYEKEFKKSLSEVIAMSRFYPAPQVMYEKVSISESYNNIIHNGKKEYKFRVPNRDMVEVVYSNETGTSSATEEWTQRTVTINDKTSQIGNLLERSLYNEEGHLLEQTINDYSDDEADEDEADYLAYKDQGVIQQAFHEIRRKRGSKTYHKGVVTLYKEYPSILKSTTTKTNGFEQTSRNVAFDFYSGATTVSESDNAFGDKFRTTSIPAYRKYPNLGIRINAPNRKHMLSQTAYTQTARIDDWGASSEDLLSASITSWRDSWNYREYDVSTQKYKDVLYDETGIWRRDKTYIWEEATNPDGTLIKSPDPSDNSFNWIDNQPKETRWILTGEVTRYDHFSKALEERDINDNYAATKMGYDETMVIASAPNAKYTDIYFSSAEDLDATGKYFGGEVAFDDPTGTPRPKIKVDGNFAHTGTHCIETQGTQIAFCLLDIKPDVNRAYKAQVWVRGESNTYNTNLMSGALLRLNGEEVTGANPIVTAGPWGLLEVEIPKNATNIVAKAYGVSSGATKIFFDDFRLHPVDAPMTSYVYNEKTGQVTHILNGENMYTQYVYDDSGRLKKVYQEQKNVPENSTGKRLVSETDYFYKRHHQF